MFGSTWPVSWTTNSAGMAGQRVLMVPGLMPPAVMPSGSSATATLAYFAVPPRSTGSTARIQVPSFGPGCATL